MSENELVANSKEALRDKSVKPKIEHAMDYLLKTITLPIPKVGDLVEGQVLGRDGPRLFVDLGPFGLGVIYLSDLNDSRHIARNLRAGDNATTKVIELENEEGFVELSLTAAGQEILWREAEELAVKKTPLDLKVLDANKGGLVIEWKSMQGFLPASQLRFGHYPRVEGGNQEKILEELKKLIGEVMTVTILSINPKENKLIFSEKGAETEEMKEMISKYKVDDTIEGEIAGIVDFGVFIKIEEGLEGLAHISELDWGLVDDPHGLFKVGEKIKAKIISIKGGKFSLSIKALRPDPWQLVKDKYKKGDIVEAVIIRFNKYGALASVEEGVAGLVHISEFDDEKIMRSKIEIGKTYPFQITLFEPDERKMTLSYLGDEKKSEEKKPEEDPEKTN